MVPPSTAESEMGGDLLLGVEEEKVDFFVMVMVVYVNVAMTLS
jgi:hypothetical protein